MITPPIYPPTPLCSVGWPQLTFVGKIFSDKLFTCENRKSYPLHTNLLRVKAAKRGPYNIALKLLYTYKLYYTRYPILAKYFVMKWRSYF
jgi:hypothetical protein